MKFLTKIASGVLSLAILVAAIAGIFFLFAFLFDSLMEALGDCSESVLVTVFVCFIVFILASLIVKKYPSKGKMP